MLKVDFFGKNSTNMVQTSTKIWKFVGNYAIFSYIGWSPDRTKKSRFHWIVLNVYSYIYLVNSVNVWSGFQLVFCHDFQPFHQKRSQWTKFWLHMRFNNLVWLVWLWSDRILLCGNGAIMHENNKMIHNTKKFFGRLLILEQCAPSC